MRVVVAIRDAGSPSTRLRARASRGRVSPVARRASGDHRRGTRSCAGHAPPARPAARRPARRPPLARALEVRITARCRRAVRLSRMRPSAAPESVASAPSQSAAAVGGGAARASPTRATAPRSAPARRLVRRFLPHLRVRLDIEAAKTCDPRLGDPGHLLKIPRAATRSPGAAPSAPGATV